LTFLRNFIIKIAVFFFIFGSTGIWIQGHALAIQAHHQYSHASRPFGLVIFQVTSTIFSPTGLDGDTLTYTSCTAGRKRIFHHTRLVDWDVVSLTCYPGWPQTAILCFSASQ
jgi:hypothetical protein